MLAIVSHSKNFDSQTALQMIFENSQSNTNVATPHLVERVPLRYSYLTILEKALSLRLA